MSQTGNIAWLRALVEWEGARFRAGDRPASLAAIRSVALGLALKADWVTGRNCWPGQRELERACGVRGETVGALRRRWVEHGWLVDTGVTRYGAAVYNLSDPCGQPCEESVAESGYPGGRSPEAIAEGDQEISPRSPMAIAEGDRDLPGRSNLIRKRSDPEERAVDEAARDLWGVYEVELSQRHGLTPKAYEPGDERRPRRLLDLRWTPEQIRQGLSAAAALAARYPENELLWDGWQTWEQDTLRTALKTYSALMAAESRREDEIGRMPALRALPGGSP